jgi:hypothetical protein
MSFFQVVTAAREGLGLREDDYTVLLIISSEEMIWFDSKKFLEDYSVYSGMKLSLFRRNATLTFTSPHFESIEIIIDITKTVADLVKIIASKAKIKNYRCYTLFQSGKKTKALRLDLDLPHQLQDFKAVVLKRCFFIFTIEDLFEMDSALLL